MNDLMKELVAERQLFRKKKTQDKMLKKGGDRESQVRIYAGVGVQSRREDRK